jgi:hypothetical protein
MEFQKSVEAGHARPAIVSCRAALAILALATMPALPQQTRRYNVLHDHLRKACSGVLTLDEHGLSFQGAALKKGKTPHAWTWTYPDIQQLTVAPDEIRVLTYKDNLWKLGADREYRFKAAAGRPLGEAHDFLKGRLDQRLVSELADSDVKALWQMPVKLLGRFRGSEGTLIVGEDRIVYRAGKEDESRTWRYADIDNISTSGPFQLTVTTFERSRSNYGSRKGFNFQLKERLEETSYNELWRRLNSRKGTIR